MERRAAAAAEEEKDRRMATCELEEGGQMVESELEAAAALAGLARRSALPCCNALDSGELGSQFPTAAVDTSTHHCYEDQSICTLHLCDNHVSTTAITTSEMTEKTVENTTSQLCSTSCQSSKKRPRLTEAEKETRKRRRVLANRESARQTIRRRQGLYLELSGKAADLLQENNSLKKEKEAAAKEYDSLRDRNEALKAELAKLNKAEPRDAQEDPNTSSLPEESSSTNSTLLQKQPSVVPCFWPSLFPSSDVLQSHCSSQGQENSIGAHLFLFPIPLLLPFQTPNEGKNTDHQSSICSCSGTRLNDNDNNNNNNNNNNNRNNQVDDTSNVNIVSAPESTAPIDLTEENREPVISPREDSDDAVAATIARKRRKELMKMKNKHCHQRTR